MGEREVEEQGGEGGEERGLVGEREVEEQGGVCEEEVVLGDGGGDLWSDLMFLFLLGMVCFRFRLLLRGEMEEGRGWREGGKWELGGWGWYFVLEGR